MRLTSAAKSTGGSFRAAGLVLRESPRLLYRSIFRVGYPSTLKQQLAVVVNALVLHVHPARVSSRSIRATTTLGLGLICFYLFVIEWITGVYLMFYYAPSANEAYGRILDLNYVVVFGRVMRNLHRWAAEAMVVVAVLHMCRVFYTGAYKAPRQFNWVLGVNLLVLTLALSFTGYLLPWDQLAFWAVTVGANVVGYAPLLGAKLRFLLLGGDSVGGEALLRFYALHVLALPTLAVLLVNYHIWRVVKDGGLASPPGTAASADSVIPTFPRLLYIEFTVFILLMAILLVAAVCFNAPLEEEANALRPNNPAKAPWYFLGLQELVSYSAFWGGVMVPVFLTLFLLALPYLDRRPDGVGVWFARERMRVMILWSLILAGILATTAIGIFFRGPNWNFFSPWAGWPGPE